MVSRRAERPEDRRRPRASVEWLHRHALHLERHDATWRYVLAARTVAPGTTLDECRGDVWIPVRFFWTGRLDDAPTIVDERGASKLSQGGVFRWPEDS